MNKAIRLAVAKMGCTNRGKRLRRRTDVIRVEESVEINRPGEEVFSYTSTPENLYIWWHRIKMRLSETRMRTSDA